MKKTILGIAALVFLFIRCQEGEILPAKARQEINAALVQKTDSTSTIVTGTTLPNAANTIYVSSTGDDATGNGTSAKPFKTIATGISKAPLNQNYTVSVGEGTFIQNSTIEVPPGVNISGAGIDKTILKSASSFYYHPTTPGYATDRFLISFNGSSSQPGNQTLKGFTIDGDSKQLHGGIYVHNRTNVVIDEVKVQNTNFTGIWLWDVKDSKIKNTQLINCSWGSNSYCSGALNVGNLERVEVDHVNIDESTGYGIKAIGPGGNNNIINVKIHDSRISVNPFGLWSNGLAPNIAIELWSVNLVGTEVYSNYVDNTISLVNSNATPSTGVQTIRVYNNIIDLDARAHGGGYGIELTIHDAEVDHNYFNKGTYGIANWDHPMKNWSIHHNTFYGQEGLYPGEIVRSQKSGLHNVKFYNNTIEFAGTKTMNVIGVYAGTSENVDIKNNLFMNSNTAYSYYLNQLIHMENGAVLNNLEVKNNFFAKLAIGTTPGAYLNNISASDPMILMTGSRSSDYYKPKAGSPLINAGINLGFTFLGSAPDLGSNEYQ